MPVAVPGISTVTAVAAGEEHSLALLANGTVLAWGDNHEGQLGDGTTKTSAVPVPVKGLSGVTAIAAGSLFSLALLNNGTVMAWGDNREGQLGDGTLRNSTVPVPVQGLSGVTAIAAGALHSLAVLANGTAMAWGDNESGQLGIGRQVSLRVVPTAVAKITGITAIAAGEEHSVALLSDGSVWVWGGNGEFQLARPNGFPGGIGQSNVPLRVPGLGKAKAIAAGGSFSLAVVARRPGQGLGGQRVRAARERRRPDRPGPGHGHRPVRRRPGRGRGRDRARVRPGRHRGWTGHRVGPAPRRARSPAPGGSRATRRTRVASTA